jgi:hypothetical protein
MLLTRVAAVQGMLIGERLVGARWASGLIWARGSMIISSRCIRVGRRPVSDLLERQGRASGKPRSDFDMIVAAVAEVNECVLVTDNEKHFPGIAVRNPLRPWK